MPCPGGKLYACLKSSGRMGWLEGPDGRRWYTVRDAEKFAGAIADAGFMVDRVDPGFHAEAWATRKG
ncbi:hypothetical protein [Streptomyces orinoci]|uniref:Uncharacterized protein n=1 Tax=Streptomyces orinoci TaxID=67339 RepID=A0ABV3K594_STRON|nr:hypothetical protein [Streptomyces orinoci]